MPDKKTELLAKIERISKLLIELQGLLDDDFVSFEVDYTGRPKILLSHGYRPARVELFLEAFPDFETQWSDSRRLSAIRNGVEIVIYRDLEEKEEE